MCIAAKHGEEGVCQGAALTIEGITIAVFALNKSKAEEAVEGLATGWRAAAS